MELGGRGGEIAGHGVAEHCRNGQEFVRAGGPPDGEQAADGDSAIEEVGKGGRVELKGENAGGRVPGGASEETAGGEGAVEVALVSGERVQVDERAGGVAGDFGGEGGGGGDEW